MAHCALSHIYPNKNQNISAKTFSKAYDTHVALANEALISPENIYSMAYPLCASKYCYFGNLYSSWLSNN